MAKTIYRREYHVLVEVMRDARARSRMTQAEVARRLGRPQSAVSSLERGSRRVDVIQFIDYCRAIGAEPVAAFRRVAAAVKIPSSPRARPDASPRSRGPRKGRV